MTTQFIIVLIGVLSSTTLIISALSLHKARMLLFGIITGILVALQYSLVGSLVGLGTLAIGLIWTTLTLFSLKYSWIEEKTYLFIPIFLTAHIVAFVLLSDWPHMSWVSYIPLIGGLGGTIAIALKDLLYTKATFIVLGGLWLVYQLNVGMYGQMVGESLNLIANSVAFGALIGAKLKGIPESYLEDLDTQLIHNLSGVHTSTTTITLPNGVLLKKPIYGAHPSSVGYGRMAAEYDRELDRLKVVSAR